MLVSSDSGSSRLELDRAKARPMFCAFHHRFLRLYAKNCARLGAAAPLRWPPRLGVASGGRYILGGREIHWRVVAF